MRLEFGAEGSVTGSGLSISFDDDALAWVVSDGLLAGTVDSEQSATLTAANLEAEVGSNIVLTRDNDASDAGVTLEQLSATYTLTDGEVFNTTITIQEDGTLEGGDESGCVYNGQVTIPDEAINLVEVSFNAANCANDERNGDFTGLGALDPETGEGSFAGTDGEVAKIFIGQR